ncbi:hypothetical protein [Shewanella baltica]|uniref:hypothetical protein n=1 Tax=Shewanella baltica TaxID=62322 RepID=UPI0001588115|nr:hypothetical protein [Shewanella baltica]ABS07830.1 hypothetical protein Shew185_1686 [Shewanella baltica OS185]MCS6114612.1 hypothetical protein [Shewanella baltica]UVW63571.1 hypothetical protein HHE93_08180 [Shewanella baltica]
MELEKIYKGVSVDEFHVKREGDSFLVSFSFTASDEAVNVKLSGVRDAGNLCEILSADRLWFQRSEGSQVEYGGYTLGVSHEHYTEIVFDALS